MFLYLRSQKKLNLIQAIPSIVFEIIFVLLILSVVVVIVSVDIMSMLPVLAYMLQHLSDYYL